jgi:prepilin-type N-terminal cleavage/methylation domain-containing protein
MSYDKSATHPIPALTTRTGHHCTLVDRGFSLVELMFVMTILAALTLLAFPAYDAIRTKAKEVRAMEEIRGLEKSINAYSIDNNGALPAQLSDIVGPNAMLDPWGRSYVYGPPVRVLLTEKLNADFDLYSKGKDGLRTDDILNSPDDIVRSGEGSFVGLASRIAPPD